MWDKKYEILSEMGPYGSVGAHIKTGRSPMAQDHFKTPPDPKKGHGMTKNPRKNKGYYKVGQVNPRQVYAFLFTFEEMGNLRQWRTCIEDLLNGISCMLYGHGAG